jgi:hypothetical protein
MALSEETSIRLIGGGGTHGLSGDVDRVLPADPALDFFSACLRRHQVAGDLVGDPDQIWSAEGNPARPGGLSAHLASSSRERVEGLSDLLVIVNSDDWQRAAMEVGVRWGREVVQTLQARVEDERVRMGLATGLRPVGVRLLADGSGPMQGHSLGLEPGELVTGLLPNLYDGPALGSRALVAVHLNLPGVWSGYREVARLYDDQDLLTIGSHWLDNYAHPALEIPALYRLQYTADEGLVHLASPDSGGRYRLQHHADPSGSSVYAVQREDGAVLAWLVLAIIEEPAALSPAPAPAPAPASRPSLVGLTLGEDAPAQVLVEESPTVDPLGAPEEPLLAQPTIDMSFDEPELPVAAPAEAPDVIASAVPENGLLDGVPEDAPAHVPAPAPALPPPPVLAEPQPAPPDNDAGQVSAPMRRAVRAAGLDEPLYTLRELGVLLQRVHFRDIMLGYEVYIGAGGELATRMAAPAATVRVEGTQVRLVANRLGVEVAGLPVPPRAAAVLGGEVEISVGPHRFAWRDLRQVRVRGWPYLGEIRRRAGAVHLTGGTVHGIGRDPAARVRLPDDPHNSNILWRPEVDAGAVIRAKNGELPKSRFTLDSIMVATHHVELDLQGEAPLVRSVARHCYSFIRRDTPEGQRIIALSRTQRPTGEVEARLMPGDDLLVGNCVFELDWTAASGDPTELPVGRPPPVLFLGEELGEDGPLDDEAGLPAGLELPQVAELPPPPPAAPVEAAPVEAAPGDAAPVDEDPTALPGAPPPPVVVHSDEADSLAFDPVPTMGWRPSFDGSADPTGLPVDGAPPPPVSLAEAPAPAAADEEEWSPFHTLDDMDDGAAAAAAELPGNGPPPPVELD